MPIYIFFLPDLRKVDRVTDMEKWHIDKLVKLIFYALTG